MLPGISPPRARSAAFTLIELLVVISIIVVISAFMGPAFNAMKGANDATKTIYDIASTLEQARSYAIANHTYTWVGFGEFDVSKETSVTPQVAGVGRIAVAVLASRDGTREYDAFNKALPTPPWPDNKGSTLAAIAPLKNFDNVHLAPLFSTIPNTGNTARPTVSSGSYQLGNSTAASNPSTCVTQFAWPLGVALTDATKAKYIFKRVINFDPTGVARIQYTGNTDEVSRDIDIGIVTTHGTAVSSTEKNIAALQLNCGTGRTSIFRP